MEKVLEEKRLQKTIEIAKEQFAESKNVIAGKTAEMLEAKRDVRENSSHSISNLYSAEGFEALAELSQCMNPVTEIVADLEEEQRKISRLERLMQKPYFARIDFRFEDEDEAEQVYIGRSSLIEKRTQERYVYDWRSPIAGVFYRFMSGQAYYDAPGGRIEGEVQLKRQYEIKDGELQYFFDTDRNIEDEFLRQMLSRNTSPQMKAIVETIQKEQDLVIRDMESALLMVQGVAGSGKTSIALHRAAYLMYQGLQSKLSANSILIVSPNTAFEEYISNVLPELGEEEVVSIVFEDVFAHFLKGKQIQTKNDFLEHAVTNNRYKRIVKNSIEYKTSHLFMEKLDQLAAGKKVSEDEIDIVELYRSIFYEENEKTDLEELAEIKQYTRENLESGKIYYDDAIAITYLYLKLFGTNTYWRIRQVVIDEAQDYYPLQYEIFRMLFPKAKFTVLGDINQTIAKRESMTLYEQIAEILKQKSASLVTLHKSFRCTSEILEFGMQFMENRPEVECFNRSGVRPKAVTFETRKALLDAIMQEIEACREMGYHTICLLGKTEKHVSQLYEELKMQIDIQGILAMPVYMSKGLEFDAVIVCDADASTYFDADDRSLLYVECTRALHRLSLFGEGEQTNMNRKELPEECIQQKEERK